MHINCLSQYLAHKYSAQYIRLAFVLSSDYYPCVLAVTVLFLLKPYNLGYFTVHMKLVGEMNHVR